MDTDNQLWDAIDAADAKFQKRAIGMDMTLAECAGVLGIRSDTLRRWHAQGCPGSKIGSMWSFDCPRVFDWRIARVREECANHYTPKRIEEIDADYERARKDRETADKISLQNARMRGELVSIAAVKRLGESVMVAIRNRILNMPLTDHEKDQVLIELLELEKIDWGQPWK